MVGKEFVKFLILFAGLASVILLVIAFILIKA